MKQLDRAHAVTAPADDMHQTSHAGFAVAASSAVGALVAPTKQQLLEDYFKNGIPALADVPRGVTLNPLSSKASATELSKVIALAGAAADVVVLADSTAIVGSVGGKEPRERLLHLLKLLQSMSWRTDVSSSKMKELATTCVMRVFGRCIGIFSAAKESEKLLHAAGEVLQKLHGPLDFAVWIDSRPDTKFRHYLGMAAEQCGRATMEHVLSAAELAALQPYLPTVFLGVAVGAPAHAADAAAGKDAAGKDAAAVASVETCEADQAARRYKSKRNRTPERSAKEAAQLHPLKMRGASPIQALAPCTDKIVRIPVPAAEAAGGAADIIGDSANVSVTTSQSASGDGTSRTKSVMSAYFRTKKASTMDGELKRLASDAMRTLQQLPADDASLLHFPLDGVWSLMLKVRKQVCMHAKAVKWNVEAAEDPLHILIEFLVRISKADLQPEHLQHCADVCETLFSTIPARELKCVHTQMKSSLKKLLDQAVAAEPSNSNWNTESSDKIFQLFLAVTGVFVAGNLSTSKAEEEIASVAWEKARVSRVVDKVKSQFNHRKAGRSLT